MNIFVLNIQISNSLKKDLILRQLVEVRLRLEKSENKLKEFREENRSIKDSPELQLQYERLQRDLEVDKQVFITLKQQYEIARIEEVKEAPVVNVLDEGRVAVERDYPKRKLVVVFFSTLSGMISLFLSYIFYKVKNL